MAGFPLRPTRPATASRSIGSLDSAGLPGGNRPSVAYDVLRVVLALLLLVSAALKGHQLATEPLLGSGLLHSRPLLVAVVELELLFGLWLIFGLYPCWTRRLTIACFGGFAVVAFYKALSGEASCGCFGRLAVNPWYTLLLDLGALAALLCFGPTAAGHPHRLPRVRLTLLLAAFVLVSLPLGWAMGSFRAATLDDSGDVFGESRFVILEPETWVGRAFPLLVHVDIGTQLAKGQWVALLYRHDCPACREIMPAYQRLTAAATGPRVALIELPPYGELAGRLAEISSRCVIGRLDDRRSWLVEAPTIVRFDDGLVTGVAVAATGDDLARLAAPAAAEN